MNGSANTDATMTVSTSTRSQIRLRIGICSHLSRSFGSALTWPQIKKERCQCQTYERTPPDQVGWIKVLHVQRVKGPQRGEGEDAEAEDERVDDGDIPGRIAVGEEKHDAQHEDEPAHLLQRDKQ